MLKGKKIRPWGGKEEENSDFREKKDKTLLIGSTCFNIDLAFILYLHLYKFFRSHTF